MHVLNLIACGSIEEAITVDDGSSLLEVVHQSFVIARSDWKRSPEMIRKVFPEHRGLATEERLNTLFGYDPLAVRIQATALCLCCARHCNVQIGVGGVEVVCPWTT